MDDELLQRLLVTFQLELAEHVRALNENLLALEKDPAGSAAGEQLKSVFRAAHSLKGAARAVGVRPIEELCHHLEDLLRGLQDQTAPLGEENFAVLFKAADALDLARQRLASGQDLAGGPIEALTRLLAASAKSRQRALAPGTAARRSAAPSPATADLPASARGRGSVRGELPAPDSGAAVPVAPASSAQSMVRVPAAKLDSLLALSGELLVADRRLGTAQEGLAVLGEQLAALQRELMLARRQALPGLAKEAGHRDGVAGPAAEARLRRARAGLERLEAGLRDDRRTTSRAAASMHDQVRRTRLLPFSEATHALERAVRDLTRDKRKQMELRVEGAAIELDRSILEGLRDPLLSLVRNAFDHGIEGPEQRRRAGKPECGLVRVVAAVRGSRVEVTVSDDGAGVDPVAVRAQAARQGLPEPKDEDALARLLFEPGFSTAADVTAISGRGVGLDIVKSAVEALHGTAEITSEPGRGTRVLLTLPVTLTTVRALLVSAGGETLALPGASVVRLLRVAPSEIRTLGGREMVLSDGAPIPILSLARVLGLPVHGEDRKAGKISAVVVGARTRVALAVDDLVAEREVLVKPLGRRLAGLRSVAGAIILETGRVALLLNPGEVASAALAGPAGIGLSIKAASPEAKKRIVLVDDSITTRSLERAILESAGYEVLTAADGEEAWRLLQERGADLVVSDVDMPRMDGIALCRAIRGSKRFGELPVVLVTSLDSDQDKARGAEAGADAYIVKSAFDQRDLLSTVAGLLGGAP